MALRPPVTPIAEIVQRLPEQGRLRLGVKAGRGMKSLKAWRFTSPSKDALDTLATMYGGKVVPWTPTNHKGAAAGPAQFELLSEASEIPVVLPPDPLSGTPIYELYGGGGRLRTCDGVTAEVIEATGDDATVAERPCICVQKGVLECNLKVRLLVILPGIRFGGVWRLESKSWNAAHELPAMVSAIQSAQAAGFVAGRLRIDAAEDMHAGKKRHYVVPRLAMAETFEALASGEPAPLALPASAPPLPENHDVVDLLDRAAAAAMISYEVVAPALCLALTKGATKDPDELDATQVAKLAEVVGRMESGLTEWDGLHDDGRARLRRLV